ncbi:ABC transporter [Paenibacillus sp. 79R4]|uniref:ABC transporter permease n=1 Tax=Paenibacillus sp. 79R4 TaxID=2212847 RepID=UPI0015B8099C|nr:ABC transporter permease [Paenibacillus sp. 79R4]NWL88814.1 ABC transporter [Paenibacillus sp. 79R4]
MELQELRRKRKSSFWSKVLPFIPYVIQSGVAVLFLLLLIAFAAWYTNFLQNIPPGLPVLWIMLLLLGPMTVYSSFRTYMQPADIIFLLPREADMKQYLSPSHRSGVIYKLIGLFLILVLVWPLYIRSGVDTKPLWMVMLVLLLLKILSAYGSWQELRITTARARTGYRLLRWCVILLMLAAWLWQPAWKSLIFMLLVGVNYVLALRFPMKHAVAWDNLIEAEKIGASKVMMWLGWFVEVPADGQKVIRRRWLSGLGNRTPWQRSTAYRFLITKTFLRSELLGIVARLTLLGMVLTGWNGASWLGIGLYLFFTFLIATQLTSLHQIHADSPATAFYPLPAGAHKIEAIRLASRLLLALTVLMWIPLAAASWMDNLMWVLLSLAISVLMVFGLRSTWIKKWKDEDE